MRLKGFCSSRRSRFRPVKAASLCRLGTGAILSWSSPLESLRALLGHTSHLRHGWKAERDFGHGWGGDPSVGSYEGPLWGRKGKGSILLFGRVDAAHAVSPGRSPPASLV